ncbi:predicted protein [Arabidopsis lyrata subsp. lyrata]|uniref:Predicted protein n=1 Tax=Arabidopsis lyrata subsp. lyrata TaxID=81972 RepID=D7KQG5_ARALL|nr:predicted protein [Arabidopsis lyrata subsp. lyrata]
MYVTRRLSEYQRNPAELTQPPPDGPNSGILVIQDQHSQTHPCCFGLCLVVDSFLSGLPLPQNLKLAARFNAGEDDATCDPVLFIPVLGKPLSSNSKRLLVGKRKTESPAAFASYVPEGKPKQLDPYDMYQQFMIHQKKPSSRYYYATSVAPDGVPPWFLKKNKWTVEYSRFQDFELRDDAKGLNTELRTELLGLGMSVVVGKWYVPFIFVKERDVEDQIKRSMYYSMTLEQRWEEVFSYENDKSENRDVVVDVELDTEVVKVDGQEIARGVEANGFVWFGVGEQKIGLGSVVVERMKWEEERFGWTGKGDQERSMTVERVEKSTYGSFWKSYHCYVLIESFVLKRMDKSLVLTYDDPQNTKVTVRFKVGKAVFLDPVAFIPVVHQPPSSNLYYVIRQSGNHIGEACVSAKEGDRASCCMCFTYMPDAEPRPLDPFDINQQFEIHQSGSSTQKFFATSVASDGIPPQFLTKKGWVVISLPIEENALIDDAKGIVDAKLRYEFPDFDKSVVVGKWYVPFLFVKDGDAKDQMNKSMYYSMTLQQRFEEVFFCENVDNNKYREVVVDVEVETEVVKLEGDKIAREIKGVNSDGVVWFSVSATDKIGLGSVVLERMKWEEERFGWSNKGDELRSSIKRTEKFEGGGPHWKSYRCYVLVESFELKRADGSLVLTYEFKHVDKLKSKWD